jgi:carbonic anhydrase
MFAIVDSVHFVCRYEEAAMTQLSGEQAIAAARAPEIESPDAAGVTSRGLPLERNRRFAQSGAQAGASVIPKLSLAVITCLDPRTDPAHFLGLELSDAIVLRNVGGRVTTEVINDLAFLSQIAETVMPDGPLFEVAVIHHTQCGAGALADESFRRRYADRIDVPEETLREHAVQDPAATVQRDVERLLATPSISKRVSLSGHVYDVVSGHLQTILRFEPQS